jgi:hypothetical protein
MPRDPRLGLGLAISTFVSLEFCGGDSGGAMIMTKVAYYMAYAGSAVITAELLHKLIEILV